MRYGPTGGCVSQPDKRSAAAKSLSTAMKQLRGDGAASDGHFREIVAHSVKATALIAPDGAVLEANELAAESFGWATDDPRGHPIWDAPKLASSDARKTIRTSVAAAASGVAVRHEVELPDYGFTIDLSLTPVADKS